ncbi:MAG TPA: CNP1-like family protein [Burkholderiales bacterium]
MRLPSLAAASLLAALCAGAFAQVLAPQYPGGYKPQFDEDKPWEEQKWALPAYPADENLLRFYVSPTTPFEFFIDSKSVSVGKDGVVRYTLVARSPSGTSNVSYEGIRCESRERRLYAFGGADRTWLQARSADWARIPSRRSFPNNQQAALADEFFCVQGSHVGSPDVAVNALARASRELR